MFISCQLSEYSGEKNRLQNELTSATRRITGLKKAHDSAKEEIEAGKQNEAKILRTSAEEKGQLEKRIETLQVCVCVRALAYVRACGIQHMSPLLQPFMINIGHYRLK